MAKPENITSPFRTERLYTTPHGPARPALPACHAKSSRLSRRRNRTGKCPGDWNIRLTGWFTSVLHHATQHKTPRRLQPFDPKTLPHGRGKGSQRLPGRASTDNNRTPATLHLAGLHVIFPWHIVLRIVAQRPAQEFRQGVTGVTPVASGKDGQNLALADPFIKNCHSDTQNGPSVSGRVGPADVEQRRGIRSG